MNDFRASERRLHANGETQISDRFFRRRDGRCSLLPIPLRRSDAVGADLRSSSNFADGTPSTIESFDAKDAVLFPLSATRRSNAKELEKT